MLITTLHKDPNWTNYTHTASYYLKLHLKHDVNSTYASIALNAACKLIAKKYSLVNSNSIYSLATFLSYLDKICHWIEENANVKDQPLVINTNIVISELSKIE